MKVSDLTKSERRVWEAAVDGTVVDLREGDITLYSPESWREWPPERGVRAQAIAALLVGDGEAASLSIRSVRLQGACITGELDLEATTLRCPLALLDCFFTNNINLNETVALSVRLSGSHVPTVYAKQLRTRGDLLLNDGFTATGVVGLLEAHIGGQFACTAGKFASSSGLALLADSLTVDGSMFCDGGFKVTGEIHLIGAHIKGQLNCTAGQFSNPNGRAIVADGLTVGGDLLCDKDFTATGEVRLVGARIGGEFICDGGQFSDPNPGGLALNANGLVVGESMHCAEGFTATGGVRLRGAHIGGDLNCRASQFSNPNSDGLALDASRLIADRDVLCSEGFMATGMVSFVRAHIGGDLDCRAGQFSNPNGRAIVADGLTVGGDLLCGERFIATSEVRLQWAHIGGEFTCDGGQFSNPNPGGLALNAARLLVDGDMNCGKSFTATGEVRLLRAHIKGQLNCTAGQFSNSHHGALIADGLTVDRDMLCSEGFMATGEVGLVGAHIGGDLNCRASQFSNSDGVALNLMRATVSGSMYMKAAVLHGLLDLTAATVGSYHDSNASYPDKLRLDEFTYSAIEGMLLKERLKWLLLNENGYTPQIYEQLASVYHASGHDEDARLILIKKQRHRSKEGNLASKMWGILLDGMVGYGYRTWLALLWLAGLLALGTILFGYIYTGDFTPASKTSPAPFQPFLYTLDLLLPVASLHQRDDWVARGAALWWSVFFIIMGWILATAVVLSLTGLLKRDVK